ncbi:hydantoinase/oxoprolinase family protein [Marinobacterium sedimentorum]|uniref:hydantoinase/oxoprolinase family protein n=1 Tax=Marinobacterium sedimentorum TaxID=2927804 RepID=UPI0020C73C9A|nr:hydantoinase/oxoprolinase family protein [Marinobacterium sedimentorum]MCP8687190.1 hydantoinase/oxoprolinase family protein [Marinobacterium sedimentorum]
MARIGVDVGGTNTDLILETTERDSIGRAIFKHKVPSTLEDQSIAVMRGILELCNQAGIGKEEVDLIVHGTTVATNISIEHNGAEVGMLTTKGFRDILHIGRHKRPHNFSLHFDAPWQTDPLVRRRNRIPINERVLPPHGDVETALDEAEVREAARLLKSRGVEAVIIGFLYSFLNRDHELRAKEIVQQEMPDAYVCCSSEVVDVMREYERFSTTAMNAYIGPRTSFYLTHLSSQLRENGIDAELRIMQSNGGVATVESCCERPVNILMSGPAGGVIGGHYFASLDGERNLITVDIGGTSADISTLVDGSIKIMNPRDSYVSGHPVLAPMIDLITIGAGGGSIAFVDEAGGFQVGPRSAGSNPGPACYGRGGSEPTVTDANIVLGRLDPDQMLGGDLKVDRALSEQAIREKIAEPLGLSLEEAALGILKIVNNNMALAIRSSSVARGVDPRDFVLMPFGGAGPVHGPALAEEVNAKAVLVPPAPGITAAAGLLTTDIQYENTRSLMCDLNTISDQQLERLQLSMDSLESEVREQLRNDDVSEEMMRISRIAECRYYGQGFELRAEFPAGAIDRIAVNQVIETFHRQHEQDYGYCFEGAVVELVTLRLIGNSESQKLEWPPLAAAQPGDTVDAFLYERETIFDDGSARITPRYDRSRLRAGQFIEGPAMLMQHDSTSLVPPGWVAKVTPYGNVIISQH